MSEMLASGPPRRRLWLLSLMAAVPMAALLATPMFGELRTTYGYAFQAGLLGWFPENIYRSFLMRCVGYKCLHYGLCRAAASVVNSRSLFVFELATRSCITAVSCCWGRGSFGC